MHWSEVAGCNAGVRIADQFNDKRGQRWQVSMIWSVPQFRGGGNLTKPLMIALLGLLASGALFKGGGAQSPAAKPQEPPAHEGAGGLLAGLGGLLERFQQSGHGNVSNSWVGHGQNQPVEPGQLGTVLGPNIIKVLAQKSGLSEEDLTKQLSQILPGVVDKLTPNGRVPTLAELSDLR
jgi:uncharacterized protein YidB (DUF937 family)